MKIRFLLCVLVLSLASCTKTVTETVVEKQIIYLQTINDSLLKIDSSKIDFNTNQYQFKISKNDSIVKYQRPKSHNEAIYNTFQKKYRFDDTFEGKYASLDSSATFTKSAITTHGRYSFFDTYSRETFIVKKLSKTYKNLNFESYSGSKHSIQIFTKSDYEKSNKPLYKVETYGNNLRLYDREGYFLSTEYGCCLSSHTYELFDLKGNYIVSSNDRIELISTKNEIFYIGIIKNEIPDNPVLFIKNKSGNTQYISFSNMNFDNIIEGLYYVKDKTEKSIYIPKYFSELSSQRLNSLDDLELWIPFNQKDTLKIPFKNQKAFGVDYPQLKILLSEKQ